MELLVSLGKETLGGSQKGASIAMASNAFTVSDNVMSYQIDTTALAATGTLNKINTTAGTRDGMVIMIQPTNNARVITVANAAGGSGQILTKDGQSKTFRDIRQWMMLQWDASATSWRVIFDDETFRINQMIGAAGITTLTISANAITPTGAVHLIDTAAGAVTCNNILTTNLADVGRVIFLSAANTPTRTPTLAHLAGGAGQIKMIDSANYVFDTMVKGIALISTGTQWNEILRWGPSVPTPTAKGQIPASTAAGTYGLLDLSTAPVGSTVQTDTTAAARLSIVQTPQITPGGRLSISNLDPYVAGSSGTIYYLPVIHNLIPIWMGNNIGWVNQPFTTLSLSLAGGTANTAYNIVAYWTGSAVALALDSYAAVSYQNGKLSGSVAGYTVLGQVYLDGSKNVTVNTASTAGAVTTVLQSVRNLYNTMRVNVSSFDTTASWTYNSATARAFNGGTIGIQLFRQTMGTYGVRPPQRILISAQWKPTTANFSPSFGIFATTDAQTYGANSSNAGFSTNIATNAVALTTSTYPVIGEFMLADSSLTGNGYFDKIVPQEKSDGTHTFTFYGSDAGFARTGIFAQVEC